jgi:hypothetical protein
MTAPIPSHAGVILSVLIIPLGATILMEVAESIAESLGWRVRLGRTGWDLCVLAVGSAGGVFTLPGVLEGWGPELAVSFGIIAFGVAIGCGLFIIHLRKTKPEDVKGWQAMLSVGLGIASLALPWAFVLKSK